MFYCYVVKILKTHIDKLSKRVYIKNMKKITIRGKTKGKLLVYMDPDMIRRLKFLALVIDKPVYQLVEEAVEEYLNKPELQDIEKKGINSYVGQE